MPKTLALMSYTEPAAEKCFLRGRVLIPETEPTSGVAGRSIYFALLPDCVSYSPHIGSDAGRR